MARFYNIIVNLVKDSNITFCYPIKFIFGAPKILLRLT